MNQLTITKLNGIASMQDLGRNHAQHLGFSGSGAADEYSFCLSNSLVGNAVNTPALEITLGQISLTANAPCRFVLTGADCQATIVQANLATTYQVNTNQCYLLAKNDTLQLHTPKQQLHSYLAIQGGFICQKWLNSASQASNEFTLGFGDPEIACGSTLLFPELQHEAQAKIESHHHFFHQAGELNLRFLASQLWQSLSAQQQAQFTEQSYQISANSNRMGYRLKGVQTRLDIADSIRSTLSKPVCFGTIQCPSDGQPIVLMKDRQTVGGYPVLGTVIQTDLFRLSQKRPGETVRFVPTTLAQAQAQLAAFREKFSD